MIQQYGLQRTGTNAMRALIEANFPGVRVEPAAFGSKHHEVDWHAVREARRLSFVVNVKDCVTWLASYYRFRAMKARDQSPDRRVAPLSKVATAWLGHWWVTTRSHLSVADEFPSRTLVVQHEALLRSPEAVLDEVWSKLRLYRRPGDPELFLDAYARRGGANTPAKELMAPARFDFRSFHLSGEWAVDLPDDVAADARRTMDAFLVENPQWRSHFNLDHLNALEAA